LNDDEEELMRKIALTAVAAAGIVLPVSGLSPASADPTTKLAQVGVEIHTDRDRDYRERREHCRDVTIRERRGDETIVRHERRCD
jgi:hypothetical protein